MLTESGRKRIGENSKRALTGRPNLALKGKLQNSPAQIAARLEKSKKMTGNPRPPGTGAKISKANKGRTQSKEAIDKQRIAMLAKNGGSYKYSDSDPEYDKWRIAVKSRDGNCCRHCGITEEAWKENQKQRQLKLIKGLECHHIHPQEFFPKLKHTIENGLTLCNPCHKIEEARLQSSIRAWLIDFISTNPTTLNNFPWNIDKQKES